MWNKNLVEMELIFNIVLTPFEHIFFNFAIVKRPQNG